MYDETETRFQNDQSYNNFGFKFLGQRKKDPCFSLARASIFQWQVKKIDAGVKI